MEMRGILIFLFLFTCSFSFSQSIKGETKKWHTITFEYSSSNVYSESGTGINHPFLNNRLLVEFTSPSGKSKLVHGYFAADGNAANTSSTSGNKWHVKFVPDEVGTWIYNTYFRTATNLAVEYPVNKLSGTPQSFDGTAGMITISPSNKSGRDFRATGRLQVVGKRYRQFAETKEYFIKAGADAPETTLSYEDFDDTVGGRDGSSRKAVKSWSPHQQDYNEGDPTWKNGKGSEIIGVVNYISEQGMNSMSTLLYNLGGDGDNIMPHPCVSENGEPCQQSLTDNDSFGSNWRKRFDISKLEQWLIVFEHAQRKGVHLHFKFMETEIDQLWDNGTLGTDRKIYLREMIARFGHLPAITWNAGEEWSLNNSFLPEQVKYISDIDAYDNLIVVHTYPNEHIRYNDWVGNKSLLTGASLQIGTNARVYTDVLNISNLSKNSGKQWVVACDETGPASTGVAADAAYLGNKGSEPDNRSEVRKELLWGAFMAGAEGVEYYYGYQTGETDLNAQDHRSRASKWKDANIALLFFNSYVDLENTIVDNSFTSSGRGLKISGKQYIVQLPNGGGTYVTIPDMGNYSVNWFNPITGDFRTVSSIINSNNRTWSGMPPYNITQDWILIMNRVADTPGIETELLITNGKLLNNRGDTLRLYIYKN